MRQATRFGLNPSDLSRQSANPSSAAALMVSNEGKREFSAQVQPIFRRSDLASIRIAAIVILAAGLGTYPQTGYSVQYHEIPKTPAERQSQRDQLEWEQTQGLRSRIGMYQAMHRGVSEEDALAALVRIAEQERQLAEAVKDPTTAATGAGGAVQDTALNGAQVDALKGVVSDVASGLLPRDAALAIIQRAFAVNDVEAGALLGTAGTTFKIDKPEPPAPFGAPPDPGPDPDDEPDDDEPEDEE
jgi:hypothetical protein